MQTGKRPTAKQASTPGLRDLPAVSKLLGSREFKGLIRRFGARLVTALAREALEAVRVEARAGRLDGPALRVRTRVPALAARVAEVADALLAPRPREVLNATGVVVHTNLGRSPLSADAAEAVARLARGYMDLEYDLGDGTRGSRQDHLGPLLARLFPGAASVVVNNNAAAVMLCLRALARGKEVLISRGELVEIGGSFRVPDILAASGARLREVGTTNRTRLADYDAAIGPRTAMILKVHTSNFHVVGFTESVEIGALAGLARRRALPLVVDWGSGDLVDLEPLGIRDELPVGRVLAAGASLVTFSGDKLLGGPQAGFVVGDAALIARLRRDPLARVCRLDRLLIAALHRTLAAYVRGRAFEEIPTLRMLGLSPEAIARRARRVQREVARRTGERGRVEVVEGVSRPGGGSSPAGERPTWLLSVSWPTGDAAPLERLLRAGAPPIIGRVQGGRLLLDLRTVPPERDDVVAERLAAAIGVPAGGRRPARRRVTRRVTR